MGFSFPAVALARLLCGEVRALTTSKSSFCQVQIHTIVRLEQRASQCYSGAGGPSAGDAGHPASSFPGEMEVACLTLGGT